MTDRQRFIQTIPLKIRLAIFAKGAQAKADELPASPERDEMLRKVRAADAASHMEAWLHSKELEPPK